MKLSTFFLTALLTLGLPAWAGSTLDALRADSQGAREQVTALRSEQLKYRSELSSLSARIEALKAASVGKLLRGGELDQALKRSQELSGTLSELASQVSSRESALEAANAALMEGLSGELTSLRATFDRETNRTARAGLIDQLRKLRLERDALRQTLPTSKLPVLDAVRPSDDPEELLEQADLLRDSEEKLRRELKSLETRIAERREEVELDRRVQRFASEESMFDDQDRRLRVTQTRTFDSTAKGGPTTAGTQSTPSDFQSGPETADSKGPTPGRATDEVRGVDARVQMGQARSLLGSGNDADLGSLESERRKLEGLAAQLKRQADALQQRASQLK